ncbi:MAG: DUF1080 domain-containing protein, partial [Cyclobacteriaceae bacterium]
MKKIDLLSQWERNYKGYFMAIGILISCFGSSTVMGQSGNTENEIIGRWDLTVDKNGDQVPSWLEVKLSGIRTLVGYFVGDNGSARPISRIYVKDGVLSFSIPPQWDDSDRDMEFEGRLDGDHLKGTIISSMGKKHSFVGERAPLMERNGPPKWGKTIDLFNGKNLEGWHADKAENQWVVNNGILESPKAGANLISDEKFEDFKLHAEFRYPEGSNSGIFLRGRYEVQIEDNKGTPPASIYFGGVYGFLTPNEMAVESAGVWQTFDITLIGRRVTIIANGKEIICDQIIPGITGGAL